MTSAITGKSLELLPSHKKRPERWHIKMAYEEQTKDIKGDIRVNIPTSLSSLSDGGAGSEADLGAPSHGQLP